MGVIRLGWVASLVFILSACNGFADSEELLAQAQQAYTEADYRDAQVRLQALVEQDPERADVHYLLAKALLATGKPHSALGALNTALELGFSREESRKTHARALLAVGQPDAVIELLPGAAELDAAGKGEELLLLGQAQARLRRWQSATRTYKAAARFEETAIEGWLALGRMGLARNDLEGAREYLEKAAEIAPGDRRIQLLTGDFALAERRPKLARQAFSSILEAKYEERAATGLIKAMLAQGDIEAAEMEVNRFAEAFPETVQSFFFRALIAEASGDHESAIEYANRVYLARPDFVPGLLIMGGAHLAQGYTSIAIQYLEQAYQLDPGNPRVRMQLARASDKAGETGRTIELLKPLSVDPDALSPKLLLARAYIKAGKKEAAAAVAAELERFTPKNADATAVVAGVAMVESDFKRARRLLEAALKENPQSNDLTFMLGKTFLAQNDTEAAISTWERLLVQQPGHVQARTALVSVYSKEKRYAEVEEHVRVLLSEHAADLSLRILLGDVLRLQGKHKSALAAYDKAYSQKPLGRIAVNRFKTLKAAGDESAYRTLESHLQQQPKDDRVRIMLAQIHQAAGREKHSIEHYEKVLARHPEQPLVLNNLALLYHKSGNEQARYLAEKAFKLAPDSPEVADTLAQILIEEGLVERALPLLEKAWSARPENPEIGYHTSLAYIDVGQPEKARTILRELLSAANPFPLRKKAEALLAGL